MMNQNLPNTYQYIIAGGGMAGLSLAFYLNKSLLKNESILIIDRDVKQANDHTWCFWEQGNSPFEEIIGRKWKGLWFYGHQDFASFLNIEEYSYKMLRGEDFYQYLIPELKKNPNITFLQADIEHIESTVDDAIVMTNQGVFKAKTFVFDSISVSKFNQAKYHNMLQHFKGWVIETSQPSFNPEQPTLFDFRIEQQNECRFVYVLPHSEKKALIEFTIFSDNLLDEASYNDALKKYIKEVLKIEDYQITEVESGVIPMSDEPQVISPSPKVIRIGTAGGYVKASTGYSFQRTQRFLQQLVQDLEEVKSKNTTLTFKGNFSTSTWKALLDSVLLNVMLHKRMPADEIFTKLFQNNRPADVLKFLDEDTSVLKDISIMHSVPTFPFIIGLKGVLLSKLY
ncbi:lycopene cyclase family protein [Arcicella sp. DC2W]|uniref:Lycopene cyclase family protein n=1 Tax=Arcicella gelida TaxID=2984195 RepID=A0ABU5S553_9BACT|nr:lycopene cyclase family protein [Arcicella sp. DC2W]MEA5403624.1 lycopene cyclase family protein [Arcicella sp. DC2W]